MSGIVSIDPGKEGAIAIWHADGLTALFDMPLTNPGAAQRDREVDARLLHDLLSTGQPDLVVLESPMYLGSISAQSVGKTGEGWGKILAACEILGIPVQRVQPREWKRAYGLRAKDKRASLDRARAEWPLLADTWFRRAKDHDRAEAALLGLWWITRGRPE